MKLARPPFRSRMSTLLAAAWLLPGAAIPSAAAAGVLPVDPSLAQMVECLTPRLRELTEHIVQPVEGLTTDLFKDTSWMYWGRLRKSLETSPEAFNRVFGEMSSSDFEKFYDLIHSGDLKLSPDPKRAEVQVRIVEDLNTLVRDDSKGFFEVPANERYQWVMDKLNEIDPRHGETHTFNEQEKIEKSQIDQMILDFADRAVKEYDGVKFDNSKKLDWLKRWWKPYYRSVQTVIGFGVRMRQSLRHGYAVDEVIIGETLKKAQELGLTPAEISGLKHLIAANAQATGDVNQAQLEVLGQEPSYKSGIDIRKVRIHETADRAAKFLAKHREATAERIGEGRLDKLSELIDLARIRKGAKAREPEEYGELELQLRYNEKDRKVGERQQAYGVALDRKIGLSYEVEYRWDEEVTRKQDTGQKDANGNAIYEDVFDHWEEHTGSDTYSPSYHDVLTGQFPADLPGLVAFKHDARVTGTPGLARIENGSRAVRPHESDLWGRTEELEKQLAGIIKKHAQNIDAASRESVARRIEELRGQLLALQNDVDTYARWDVGRIEAQWSDDNPQRFRERNQKLAARLVNAAQGRIDLLSSSGPPCRP